MSRTLAIDLDAGGLYAVLGSLRKNAATIERALVVLDDPHPLSLATAAAIGNKLKAALAEAKASGTPALLSLGRDRVIFKDIKHPPSSPAEEPAIVRFQAQRDLAVAPDTLLMDYVPVPGDPKADERKAVVAFIPKDLYEAARQLCDAAGVKLMGVQPRPYAIARTVARAIASAQVPPPDGANAAVGTMTLSELGGEFVVSSGPEVLFSRTVSAGALASEVALLGETRRSLAGYASSFPARPLGALYVAEGYAAAGSWIARLQQSLPLPVHPLDPLFGLSSPAAFPSSLNGRYAGAVGLLAGRAAGAMPLNFVAPRQPRAESKSSTRWMVIAAMFGLLICLGAAAAIYLVLGDLDRKIAAAAAKKKFAEDQIAKEAADANRLRAILDFKKRDVTWLDVLYDLSDATGSVDKMRLKEFDGNIRQVTIAAKPGATGTAAKPVQTMMGQLELKLVSADDQQPQDLMGLFSQENKFYANPTITFNNLAGMKMGADGKEVSIAVDVLPRKPSEFVRQLKAEFPKPPPEEKPPVIADEEDLP